MILLNNRILFLFASLLGTIIFCSFDESTISLAGKWNFKMDPQNIGLSEKWFSKSLSETVVLPGSMAQNLKGDEITLKTKWTGSIYDSSFYFNPRLAKYRREGNIKIPFWLTPAKHYVGVAWYQKEVTIPKEWKDKRITIYLERAHIETRIWVDDTEIGTRNSLVAAHEYDLTGHLSPGTHRITISVDNRIKEINVGPDSHSVTDHTQGNWNGLIGKMMLNAVPETYLDNIQVYPDLSRKAATVKIFIHNSGVGSSSGKISISAKSFNTSIIHQTQTISGNYDIKQGESQTIELQLPFGTKLLTWDEFNPALYRLNVTLKPDKEAESVKQVQFGMREFTIKDGRFLINNRPVFLRGTLNNCEFPLTGYPSMDVAAWQRIFKIAKAHGLNHMRFHSWCPPEAAFIAADLTGFYLQPEGPSWPNHGPKIGLGQPIDKFLYDETERMARNYGNYASFTMLSAGNEPAGNQVQYLNAFVDYWKKKDKRRVYTGMSVGGSWPVIPNAEYQVRGGVRGLTWDKKPESLSDFSSGIQSFKVPFIAHEMGQWCVFPDFKEIRKYTGVYRAKNFELFQEDLQDHGMAGQAEDFLMASGKLQVLCYKNEIEKALRTPGYDGFQLLGLQDFPGQGTALVGVLNAFWEDKAYISAKEFSRFCNSTVPLASLPKFVFNADESFTADIKLFHSGKSDLKNVVINWTIKDEAGKVFKSGKFQLQTIPNGNGIPIGKISLPLTSITKAQKLNLEVALANTSFINDWDFWVYPAKQASVPSKDIYYTTELDEKAKNILEEGGKVFLNAAGKVVKGKDVAMYFLPVFWNTSWFKMKPPHVTGMLIQSKSPAFANFPTDYYSDLQWWEIANRSQVMILEDFPDGFRPLVQPIDTWFLNRRLGLIYEVKVGKGKLIVSSADLRADLQNKPAATQLFGSLQAYMQSDKFNPQYSVSFDVVNDVFVNPSRESFDTFTKDSPDELKPNSNQNKPKN